MYEWTSCHVMNERGHCAAQVFARCLCGEKWSAVLSRHWTSFCCVFPLHYCVWSTELSLKVGHLWYMLYRCVIPYTFKFSQGCFESWRSISKVRHTKFFVVLILQLGTAQCPHCTNTCNTITCSFAVLILQVQTNFWNMQKLFHCKNS